MPPSPSRWTRHLLAACSVVLAPMSLQAEPICYDDRAYPVVLRIEPTPDGAQIQLGGRYLGGKLDRSPRLRFSRDTGWTLDGEVRCPGAPDGSDAAMPCSFPRPRCRISADEDLEARDTSLRAAALSPARASHGASEKDLARLQRRIGQEVGACIVGPRYTWLGVRLDTQNEVKAKGRILRLDRSSHHLESRVESHLREVSVVDGIQDGDTLYLATARYRSCAGQLPARGLVAYRWSRAGVAHVPTCGRSIYDLALVGDQLWVATELGLSIGSLDPKRGRGAPRIWTHWEPRLEADDLMQQVSCRELYASAAERRVPFPLTHRYSDSRAQLLAAGYGTHAPPSGVSGDRAGSGPQADPLFEGARACEGRFAGAALAGAKLRAIQLGKAQLPGADLSESNLRGADLSFANLQGARLVGADLRHARLRDTDLAGAELSGANLQDAELRRADLSGADLSSLGAGSPRILQQQLDVACGDETTRVPGGLEPPPPCAQRDLHAAAAPALLESHQSWLESEGKSGARADLRGASLPKDVRLSGRVLRRALLRGLDYAGADLASTDLRGADLRGARLTGADLSDADLRGALLSGTILDRARLERAKLAGASLQGVSLVGVQLRAVDLSNVALSGARLIDSRLTRVRLKGASLDQSRAKGSAWQFVMLSESSLIGSDLDSTHWIESDLSFANLSGASLRDSVFESTSMLGVQLVGADLSGANLERADLREAKLSRALLSRARLQRADFSDGQLDDASFRGAHLSRAKFDRANLSGADFTGATGLRAHQLKRACGDAFTRLPDRVGPLTPCNQGSAERTQ